MPNYMKMVQQYIEDFEQSQFYKDMKQGNAYFRHHNTEIMKRSMKYMSEKGIMFTDPYKANNKLPSSFMRLQVKQKVNYSINAKTVIDSEQEDRIDSDLKGWRNGLKQIGNEASKKAVGYWFFYIEDNKLKFKVYDSEQYVIIPPPGDPDGIQYAIRYYDESVTDQSGKTVVVKKAEFYDDQQVYYFMLTGKPKKKWRLDESREYNPKPHITRSIAYGQRVEGTEFLGWGRPPIARLWNNDEHMTDLSPIKDFIDIYDIVNSDFANNLEDFQDVYWILKNYGGEPVEEVLKQIKQYKVLATPEDGDAKTATIDIPVEARNVMLTNIEKLIYTFGMAVNHSDLQGNITNFQVESLYTNLNLKADDFEDETQVFWQQVMYFLNKYYQMMGQPPVESELLFKRNITLDLDAMLTANANQVGVVSNRTRLMNHPWVDDPEEEMALMEAEAGGIVIEDEPQLPAPRPEESLEDYGERVMGILVQDGVPEDQIIDVVTATYNRFRS